MINLNKALIAGNLTKKPTEAKTNSGITVTNFSVATNKNYTDKDGNKKSETEYHDIVFFGKTAENIVKYLDKGSHVLVEGEIKTRSWEGDDGKKRYRTEIIGNNIQFGARSDSKGSSQEFNEDDYAGGEEVDINLEEDDIDIEEIDF